MVMVILAALAGQARAAAVAERIWLDARIKRKPVKLVFDSGAAASVLLPRTVQQLGLKTLPYTNGDLPATITSATTEELPVTIEGGEAHITFVVLNLPRYVAPDFDGVVGWWDVSGCVVRLDCERREIEFLEKLPKETAGYTRLGIVTNSGTLDLEIPGPLGSNRVLCIDTGSPSGVAIPLTEWERWKEGHDSRPSTLGANFTPSDDFYVFREAWGDNIQFGPLLLTAVPIQSAGPFNADRYGAQYAGTLGIEALRQLDLVIDGPRGQAYVRMKKIRPRPYVHNRLGAVFVPTPGHTNQGIAQVVRGSPAYIAGIRNGDRLLQVGEVPVRGLTTDWLSQFEKAPGTKLELTLERNNTNFTTTAVLRDIVTGKPDKHE
jgi:hypothetical protein